MRWLRDHGLSVVIFIAFLSFMAAQIWTGRLQHNEELREHGELALTLPEYLASGHFREATAENWESEFLRMAAYVLLTVGLYQKGSSESKDPDKREPVDRDPRNVRGKAREEAPGPYARGAGSSRFTNIRFRSRSSLSFWCRSGCTQPAGRVHTMPRSCCTAGLP